MVLIYYENYTFFFCLTSQFVTLSWAVQKGLWNQYRLARRAGRCRLMLWTAGGTSGPHRALRCVSSAFHAGSIREWCYNQNPRSCSLICSALPPPSPLRSTCGFWSMKCTTQTSASGTLSPSTMVAAQWSTWRTSFAPLWPTTWCWLPRWGWWGCGPTRGAGRAGSRSSLRRSTIVS